MSSLRSRWSSVTLVSLCAIPLWAGCVVEPVDSDSPSSALEEGEHVSESAEALLKAGPCPANVSYCFYEAASYGGRIMPFAGPFSISDTSILEMPHPDSLKKKNGTLRVELWSQKNFTGACEVILPNNGPKNYPDFPFKVRSMRAIPVDRSVCVPGA